jgi:hypothetical protein
MSHPGSRTTNLRFLFDKRLSLFNVRRQHEWKVLFGVVVALGAADFALLQQQGSWVSSIKLPWLIVLCILFGGVYMYELGVQERNRIDRLAMDELYQRLCDSVEAEGEPRLKAARLLIDGATFDPTFDIDYVFHYRYLWAFFGQMLVLFVACAVSAAVPFVVGSKNSGPLTFPSDAFSAQMRAAVGLTLMALLVFTVVRVFHCLPKDATGTRQIRIQKS